MELEAVKLVAEWLKHPTYGVNALLPSQPLAAIDAGLDWAALGPDGLTLWGVQDVLNEYEDDTPTSETDPANNRTLLVLANGMTVQPFKGGGPVVQWDADGLELGVAYLLRDVADRKQERRVVSYTLRAVRQSLLRLATYNQSDRATYRALNGVELLTLRRMQYERLAGTLGRAALMGVNRCTWQVRDSRP